MRVYSKKMFFSFLLLTCVAGVAVVALTTWSLDLILPIRETKIYQQLVNYDNKPGKPLPCVRLNHTIIVSGDTPVIESVLTVTKKTDLPPDVKIEINFGALTPRLIDGNLTWSGQMYANQTKTLYTKLAFDTDGTYYVDSQALAYSLSDGHNEGSFAGYYITVQGGKITQVTDKNGLELTPNTQIEATRLLP